jgi:hypothetical protein
MGAFGPIMQTVALSLLVFSVFAILGMQVLSGKLGYCSDPMVQVMAKCTGYAIDATKRMWMQRTGSLSPPSQTLNPQTLNLGLQTLNPRTPQTLNPDPQHLTKT